MASDSPNATLDHIPEYFAKPGIVEAIAETHPMLLVRQMANEIKRLRSITPSASTATSGATPRTDAAVIRTVAVPSSYGEADSIIELVDAVVARQFELELADVIKQRDFYAAKVNGTPTASFPAGELLEPAGDRDGAAHKERQEGEQREVIVEGAGNAKVVHAREHNSHSTESASAPSATEPVRTGYDFRGRTTTNGANETQSASGAVPAESQIYVLKNLLREWYAFGTPLCFLSEQELRDCTAKALNAPADSCDRKRSDIVVDPE